MVFWETGAVPKVINPFTCFNNSNLVWFEIPSTVELVDTQAFQGTMLRNRDLRHCTSLKKITSSAFNGAFGYVKDETVVYLPGALAQVTNGLSLAYNTDM